MNKEYIYLSSEELVVTDEQGHAKKRIVESDNMHDLLLTENDLEKINNLIKEIEDRIDFDDKNKLNFIQKFFVGTSPFWFTAILVLIGFVHYGPNGLMTSIDYISGLSAGVILSGVIDVPIMLQNKKRKKHYEGLKAELSKAYEIKEGLEKELEESKKKYKVQEQQQKEHTISTQNDIVVLEDNTPAFDNIITQLDDSYTDGYNQSKSKRLVLTKTSKK